MQLGYSYDKNGNLTRISTTDGQHSYDYDPSGNLKSLNHRLGEGLIGSYLYGLWCKL
ncbi:RHS repeat protein [Clostridia bacterium]|nr:RHS repeat protein [Clostridia bacterium]